ncbi:MAG: N-6 DNA Methylase [Syntrophorhabdus sp. PtaU1.Bin153]|nr:MAG: N-6 DNA Methylase [Syntrophorhabdus sp. PtaU1.Bin153]
MLYNKPDEPSLIITATFKTYFNEIKALDPQDATEHTLRPALHNLLTALAEHKESKIKVVHEPKRDKSGKGAPDFKFKIDESMLGYLENKSIEVSLDQVLKSEQIAKYKRLSNNLILTNYLEWIWLKDGVVAGRETLAYRSDVGYHKAHLDPDKAGKVGKLIGNFLSTAPKGVSRVDVLALSLATRCHDLREFLTEELIRQEKEHQEGRLFGLFNVFKKDVFHELTLAGFADAFAQMLGYGLFLARINSGSNTPVTLINAKQYIPTNFELIRELVNFLDELDKREYHLIKWLIEEILSLMNTLDLPAIKENLSFTKSQGRIWAKTEEERLLFTKDPYVYFYEDFLKAYDKKLKKSRGVYYTPPPIVNFIVRAINHILMNVFGIKQGLADRKRVTALDFATGTGTFILEILQQICDVVPDGLRDQVIREHALKNLYGFEYLIAPYTIAHLKLSQFLRDKEFTMHSDERLQIYLTNTLEPIDPQPNFLLPALSKEVEYAQKVKDKPVLVITGNPPYNVKSQNNGAWIIGLIRDYYKVDGLPLGERNPKNLQDDYVKFIRFAQWKMDHVDEGVVGIITNHSFLDNPTFRGMRQSLMQTYNQIYILDLHGNNKKKEKAPDGTKDVNVFDIEQGVCISLFIRKQALERKIYHADLRGKRSYKYRACLELDFGEMMWSEVIPQAPLYLFVPQDETQRDAYERGLKITSIFPIQSSGVKTHRDHFVLAFDDATLKKRIEDFKDLSISDNQIAEQYNLRDTGDWSLTEKRQSLANDENYSDAFTHLLYRPFDTLAYFHHNDVVERPRNEVMKHLLNKRNHALCIGRQFSVIGEDVYDIVAITDHIVDTNYYRRGGVNVFPLYIYRPVEEKKTNVSLFEEADPFEGKDRIENFDPEFRTFIDKRYGHHYEPEEILNYIYAVLHTPSYRKKYAPFLNNDFPRIPFVEDNETFDKLSTLGRELVQAHLLKDIPEKLKVKVSNNDDPVETPVYDPKSQHLYVNKNLYFVPVPEDVWNFHIGGYQVLDRYLKYRKGRKLTLDEKENVINIVRVLRFTIDQMNRIDEIWQP